MSSGKQRSQIIQDINIVDLILIDHQFIKDCIEVFRDEKVEKTKKLSLAKPFLDAIHLHTLNEKKIVYKELEKNEEFHFNILEADIEHGIVEEKIKLLKPRVSRCKYLRDELEAELKVVADLIRHHIIEEESEILPKMNSELDEHTLSEMGQAFMKARKFTPKELRNYPKLQDELIEWKDNVQKVSSEYLSKMDKFVESMNH